MEGVFISLEGIDGSGKSTLAGMLAEYLAETAVEVVSVREPGSTALAESVREILLQPDSEICGRAELMLYEAARAQLTNEVIRPALSRGAVVVADRFGDSSVAYQGYGRELGPEAVRLANDVATGGLVPDVTFVVDVPIEVGFARRGKDPDRIEREGENFHQRVREGFLAIAEAEPERVLVIDGTQSTEEVFSRARDILLARLTLGDER